MLITPETKHPSSPVNLGQDIARTSLLVMVITTVSRILGFARDMLLAYLLGANSQADMVIAVFRLPNFIRRLTSEGCISMPFIPEYILRLKKGGEAAAMDFARSAMLWTIILTTPVLMLAMLFPKEFIIFLAPGFASKNFAVDSGAMLLNFILPYSFMLCALGVGASIMQARSRFIAPALTPCIPNITVLAAMLLALFTGYANVPAVPAVPATAAMQATAVMQAMQIEGGNSLPRIASVFCQALLFSGLLQWLYVLKNMREEKLKLYGPFHLTKAFKFIASLPLSLCATAVHQSNILIAGMGASFLASGAITKFHYADQLLSFPIALFTTSLGVTSLPSLTALAHSNNSKEMQSVLSQNIRLALFLTLPAAAGIAGVALPLVEVLFVRGAFNAQAAAGTALALAGASLCLPALALSRPLLAACHAYKKIKLTAVAGTLSMAFTAIFSLVLPLAFSEQNQLLGIGLAVSCGASIFASILWLLMRKKNIAPPLTAISPLFLPFIFSLAIFFISKGASTLVYSHFGPRPLACLILVPLCSLGYFKATASLKSKECHIMMQSLKIFRR